ncbi:MAG: dodecin family protein [Gammaproteobacteria bacterium]|nr:dodecin family protein [Gammaproteobacteria bacterium]
MNNHIYKMLELTGSSTTSSDDAIVQAIARASASVRHIEWFEVVDMRGFVKDGAVAYWQVTLKAGFRLED